MAVGRGWWSEHGARARLAAAAAEGGGIGVVLKLQGDGLASVRHPSSTFVTRSSQLLLRLRLGMVAVRLNAT